LNILAIETATEACSVALLTRSGEIFSVFELAPRLHTKLLPMMLDQVMKTARMQRNDLDYIACGKGPGAFTGVRIAAATAQGMAIGLGVPLLGVSTLAILAQHACDTLQLKRVQAMLDARMGEIYSALFEINDSSGLVVAASDESLLSSADFVWAGCAVAGPGVLAACDAGSKPDGGLPIDDGILPHAEALVKLARMQAETGLALPPDKLQINYLRNQVAWRN
jgi:tRNA threonylcarbamoyladenosine biosynthesis protein TsaB